MSRSNKYEGYATYSTYNLTKATTNSDNAARFSNMPPPTHSDPFANNSVSVNNVSIVNEAQPHNTVNVANSAGTNVNASPLPQPFYPHTDQSRVNHIDPDKLYDLLMNPKYHFI
jgi:hypothetical protein